METICLAEDFKMDSMLGMAICSLASIQATKAAGEDATPLWPFDAENPPILVPAGTFRMGSLKGDADERPVSVDKQTELSAYFLSKTPITVGQYRRYLLETAGVTFRAVLSGSGFAKEGLIVEAKRGETVDQLRQRAASFCLQERAWRIEFLQITLRQIPDFAENKKGDDYPIVGLRWSEARTFCRYYGGDLPTAAQMERAAKGKSAENEFGTPVEKCTASDNGATETVPVMGSKAEERKNDLGFIDLGGNVWAMTLDRYEKDWYQHLPEKDPCNLLTDENTQAVELRGGHWFYHHINTRAANRYGVKLDTSVDFAGFRVAWPTK